MGERSERGIPFFRQIRENRRGAKPLGVVLEGCGTKLPAGDIAPKALVDRKIYFSALTDQHNIRIVPIVHSLSGFLLQSQ